MKKYSLDVWLSGSKECFGLFDSEEVALEEGRILECSLGHPVKYAANPVQIVDEVGNDSNLLIVFYVQIMPDDFVMQLHRF